MGPGGRSATDRPSHGSGAASDRGRADPLTAHDLQNAVFPVAETAAGGSPMIVGKITGTFNCQWADPCVAARVGEPVPQGRKYPITSGLLEITYNTGAKVIIEGPANYSASARNAASLYFGKLTADVGKLDRAKPMRGEQALGPPLPSSHVPAFRVHTPSGVVTDNGDQNGQVRRRGCPAQDNFPAQFPRAWSPSRRPASTECTPCRQAFAFGRGKGAKHDSLLIFKPGPETLMFVTKMPTPPPVCMTQPKANEGGRKAQGGS